MSLADRIRAARQPAQQPPTPETVSTSEDARELVDSFRRPAEGPPLLPAVESGVAPAPAVIAPASRPAAVAAPPPSRNEQLRATPRVPYEDGADFARRVKVDGPGNALRQREKAAGEDAAEAAEDDDRRRTDPMLSLGQHPLARHDTATECHRCQAPIAWGVTRGGVRTALDRGTKDPHRCEVRCTSYPIGDAIRIRTAEGVEVDGYEVPAGYQPGIGEVIRVGKLVPVWPAQRPDGGARG